MSTQALMNEASFPVQKKTGYSQSHIPDRMLNCLISQPDYTSWAMSVSLSPGQKSMGGISGSV